MAAINKVEVSADGGKSWALAALHAPVLTKALTRFRMPWNWDGQPAILQSRATDEAGNVQPTRAALIAERGSPKRPPVPRPSPWRISTRSRAGASTPREVSHVYA